MRSLKVCATMFYGYLRIVLMVLVAASAVEIDDNESEFGLSKAPASRSTDRFRSVRVHFNAMASGYFSGTFAGFQSPIYCLSFEAGKIQQGLVPLTLFGFLSIVTPAHPSSWFLRTWGTRGPPLTFVSTSYNSKANSI